MNSSRLAAIEQGLNGTAKKVLDAITDERTCDRGQIVAALGDRGVHLPFDRIEGSLATLVDKGLVIERPKGVYRRVSGKAKPAAIPPIVEQVTSPAPVAAVIIPAPKPDPVELLSSVAATLRSIATDLEDAALAIEEERVANSGKTEKVRELAKLLKEFS